MILLHFIVRPGLKLGKAIIEGKTKVVHELVDHAGECLIVSKDRISAGDGARMHDMAGKAAIATATTAKIFELLNTAGKFPSPQSTDMGRI